MSRLIFGCFILLAIVGCAGSTSFIGDNPAIQLLPGAMQSVTMEFEAEGSHTGEYAFSASPSTESVTAQVMPGTAEVDGVQLIVVTITAASDAEAGFRSVFVEGKSGNNSAGQSISVQILEAGTNAESSADPDGAP